MSENAAETKLTTVEAGTTVKGTLSSESAVLVRGSIEGDVRVPLLTVAETGAVIGQIDAQELHSAGTLGGRVTADAMYISGTVRDNTVIHTKSLEVNPERRTEPGYVVFGDCVLEVGDEPALRVMEPTPSPPAEAKPQSAPETAESSSEAALAPA